MLQSHPARCRVICSRNRARTRRRADEIHFRQLGVSGPAARRRARVRMRRRTRSRLLQGGRRGVRSGATPPRYEVVGVAPAPGYLWISGAWLWERGRYAWHPGRWEAPRPGYRWVPHAWRREGNRWHMEGGRWEREEHERR